MEQINPLKDPVEYQEKVLELMKKYELLIGELYLTYSKKFPEYEKFWHRIHKEEESHAYWLETLANRIGDEKVYFDERRFNLAPLNECIKEVNAMIETAKNEQIALLEAISCSVGIENGMIERSFFEVFESDSPEIRKTFEMLRIATMQHGKAVKEIWDNERAKTIKEEQGFWKKIKNFF